MKTLSRLILAGFAMSLAFRTTAARADQPSIDHMALDSGVVAWVSAWNPGDKPFDVKRLERLYRANVVTKEGERTLKTWSDYAESLKPCVEQFVEMTAKPADELKVKVSDRSAETTFVLHPAGKRQDGSLVTTTTRVRLVWEKEGGLWRISQQEIVRSKDSDTAAVVAR